MSVDERVPLCQLQSQWSSSRFNAPHMKLIRVSAHKGGAGSQRCTACVDRGSFTVRARGAMSILIILVPQKLRRWVGVVSLAGPPSVHLLCRLLGWRSGLPVCSPKLYFFIVCSQQELKQNLYSNISPSSSFQ